MLIYLVPFCPRFDYLVSVGTVPVGGCQCGTGGYGGLVD